eukprot:6199189-Pleurochrysis_carterae.AAC.1
MGSGSTDARRGKGYQVWRLLACVSWLFLCGCDLAAGSIVAREPPRFTAKAWLQKCRNNPEINEVPEVRRDILLLCAWIQTDSRPAQGRRPTPTGEVWLYIASLKNGISRQLVTKPASPKRPVMREN